jgi:hypothetical protein
MSILGFMLHGSASLAFWHLQFFDNYQGINNKVGRNDNEHITSADLLVAIFVPSSRFSLPILDFEIGEDCAENGM